MSWTQDMSLDLVYALILACVLQHLSQLCAVDVQMILVVQYVCMLSSPLYAYKPSAGKNLRSFLSHTLNERSFLPSQMAWHVTEGDSRTIFLMQLQQSQGIILGTFQKRNITSFCLWCGLEGFERHLEAFYS